jgi:hypothetical protein
VEEKIKRLRESHTDLPFSYFIEELIMSGLKEYENEKRRRARQQQ